MKKTIARIGYFSIEAEADGTEIYGPVTWLESKLSGGREFSAEPTGETTEIYADGICVYSVEENAGYTIKLTLLALIDKVEKDWLGFTVDAAKGAVAEYANAGERPYFGLAVAVGNVDGTTEASFYYNCQVSKRPTDTVKTAEGKLDPQFSEFELSARPRAKDTLVRYKVPVSTLPSAVPEPEAPILKGGA